MTSPSDNLRAARALIADPARWTTEVMARGLDDAPVDPMSEFATCWCALGALARACNISCSSVGDPWAGDNPAEVVALDHAAMSMSSVVVSIVGLNDLGTHADVMRAFDDAIAIVEAL